MLYNGQETASGSQCTLRLGASTCRSGRLSFDDACRVRQDDVGRPGKDSHLPWETKDLDIQGPSHLAAIWERRCRSYGNVEYQGPLATSQLLGPSSALVSFCTLRFVSNDATGILRITSWATCAASFLGLFSPPRSLALPTGAWRSKTKCAANARTVLWKHKDANKAKNAEKNRAAARGLDFVNL